MIFLLFPNSQAQVQFMPYEAEGIKGFERGFLEVPENRHKKESRKLRLPVLRYRSESTPAGTPVVYLSGGPGGSAAAMLRIRYMRELFKKIARNHDILLLEQRGTPLCEPTLYWPAAESFPPDIFTTEQRALEIMRERSKKAVDHFRLQGADLAGYTTTESADDIEALRLALGVPELSLLGFSYGTHLTLATVKRHESKLDRVVLIGTEGLDQTLKYPSVYDRQLENLSNLAAEVPPIREYVPNMKKLFERLLQKLDQEPVVIEIRDTRTKKTLQAKLGKFGLQALLRFDLGDGNDFVDFPRVLYKMDQGDFSGIQPYLERRYNQFGSGIQGVSYYMDLASWASSERIARIREEAKTSLFGNSMNFPMMDVADIWGNPDLGDEFRAPVRAELPALFISGTLDVNTPPYQAAEIVKGFKNGHHLIVEYAGHEDTLPNEGVQKTIIDFFNGQKPSAASVSLPKPRFKPVD